MDDDNNDGDNQLNNATFEQDGTFTGSSSTSLRQNSNEQQKPQTQSSVDESTSSRGNAVMLTEKEKAIFYNSLCLSFHSLLPNHHNSNNNNNNKNKMIINQKKQFLHKLIKLL